MHEAYHFNVSIIGCGSVGATAAYALLLRGVPTKLTLIDRHAEKAEGLKMDLEHSLLYTSAMTIESSGDYSAVKGSDLVVITAGKRQAEGETRLDLANANKAIFREMIPKIASAVPEATLLIVTNPVDVLTYETLKISGFPPSRVFGSGTMLDSARFQFHISQKIQVHPKSIDAYILGEHGDSSFPVWSFSNVLGKPLKEFPGFSAKVAAECYEMTKSAAYRIINDLGYTCYSIATVISDLAQAMKENSHEVFPLSTLLQNCYGHSDVCLSVPCVLGRSGIEQVLTIPLDQEEQNRLSKSVEMVKKFIAGDNATKG